MLIIKKKNYFFFLILFILAEENNAFTDTTHTNFYFDCSNEGIRKYFKK